MTEPRLSTAELDQLERLVLPDREMVRVSRLIAEVREWREYTGDVVFTYEMETGCECGGREIEDADDAQNGPLPNAIKCDSR